MDLVLTPAETAARLGLETAEALQFFESGRISGFRLGEEWRITPAALQADLERIHFQVSPPPPIVLGPRSATAFRIPPSLRPAPSRVTDRRQYSAAFTVRILLENNSDYAGEFALYLASEGASDRWDVQYAPDCERVDCELLIRQTIAYDQTITMFVGGLHGHMGDRLFLAVPAQPAVTEEFERVYVLQGDLSMRISLANRGLLSRRRVIKIKELPSQPKIADGGDVQAVSST